ncbi:MAG: CDP-glycerol glycerophosphotransferase family protein [Planctomycetales bacterium]|nr:CDP-glycerol glycerophosphotransferase family protein [Planctomycetales bacterium]
MRRRKRVLFGGYAPVHFVCFRPVWERLRRRGDIEFLFTGGRRIEGRDGRVRNDLRGMYGPFGVPPRSWVPLGRLPRISADASVSAFSSGYFPGRPGTRVEMFHGVSFRNMSMRDREKVRGYDALFVVGPYMMRTVRRRRMLARGGPRALPIGFPKLDPLVDGSLDRAAILRRLGLSGRRPVLLYAPTGAKQNSLETMGEEVIRRLKATRRYDLLVKPHDHPKNPINWFRRLRPLTDAHTRVVRDLDIVPLFFVADLLLSDASSAAMEYSLLDRPIVFLDVPRLLAAVRGKGIPLDLGTWGRRGGVTARTPAEAVRCVARALANPGRGSRIRRAMAGDLFYAPGGATQRAADALLGILGLPAEAP